MKNKLNKNFWNKHGHVVIIYVFLVALMLLVSVFSRDFFTIGNFKNLLRTSFPLLMVALGQTLIILTGGIDLSLGGIVALANVVCVMTMNTESPVGFILPLIAAVVLGLVCGALNGVLVTRGNLAPIIVTIATTAIFDGCALLLMPKPGGSVHKAFSKFLTRGLKGAVPLILFLVILILVRTLTNQTPYGKALRAIGGSEGKKGKIHCLLSGRSSLCSCRYLPQCPDELCRRDDRKELRNECYYSNCSRRNCHDRCSR